ncbi:10690_t:CDS:2, partial [Acaulospora morrowiae]
MSKGERHRLVKWIYETLRGNRTSGEFTEEAKRSAHYSPVIGIDVTKSPLLLLYNYSVLGFISYFSYSILLHALSPTLDLHHITNRHKSNNNNLSLTPPPSLIEKKQRHTKENENSSKQFIFQSLAKKLNSTPTSHHHPCARTKNFMSVDGESSRINRNHYLADAESDYLDHNIPPYNVDALISNPYLKCFLDDLSTNDGYSSVDSFSRMLYFDGAGSYVIPHHDAHMQQASQSIIRIFQITEQWLIEKLFHNSDSMPILEESPQDATDGIMHKLKEVSFALNGLSRVLISIRAGHVYSLHMIGDEIVMPESYESFAKRFPLFVNISVDVQTSHPFMTRHDSHNTCRVLVAAERVTTSPADGKVFFRLGELILKIAVRSLGSLPSLPSLLAGSPIKYWNFRCKVPTEIIYRNNIS